MDDNYENINIEELRKDLTDYFGTAMFTFPVAMMDLIDAEKASGDELIQIALNNGFNLDNYFDDTYKYTRTE